MLTKEDEAAFQRATHGSIGGNLVVLFFAILKLALGAILDGLLIFVVFAAIGGFVSWLAGAQSPRDVALLVGGSVGGLWAFIQFSLRMIQIGMKMFEEFQKARIQEALEEDEE